MPRAVWTGTLAFGLVTIPVRLFPATEPKDVRFHLMDAEGRRVRYRRFVEAPEPEHELFEDEEDRAPTGPASDSETADDESAYEDLVRGVERDDGQVVLLDAEDSRGVQREPRRSSAIEGI